MTLKVGDKVRPLDPLKSIHFPDLSVVEVLELREGRYSVLAGEPGNYLNAVWAKPTELAKIEDPTPKFKVGDRVRLAVSCDGIPTGTTGTVARAHRSANPAKRFIYGVDFPLSKNHAAFEFRLEKVESVPFKLERGDKVVNRKTGRTGFVAGGLVYDYNNIASKPVPTKAVEEYEEWHPGTYDLIKMDAPW